MSNDSIVTTCNLTNRQQFSMVCTLIDVLKTRVTALTKKLPHHHVISIFCTLIDFSSRPISAREIAQLL